jgi:predicted AAA+ superfamily ATPase
MGQEYIPRQLGGELQAMAKEYPVATLIGPRQSGKTTLAKHLFPSKAYFTLESIDIRARVEEDPRRFLEDHPNGIIIDEIQRAPQLLSYIQEYVDAKENQQKGQFILTGSHQLELLAAITQSLAGRTALLTLFPLSLYEIKAIILNWSLDKILLEGGFPRIYKDGLNPTKAYRNYFHTYVERDVRSMINLKDIALFEKFIKLCAGRIGQLINFQSLASDTGVSYHTIQHWLSILEASFILFRLQPYFENFGKRLLKSAKLYFTDVGLAAFLLGIENEQQMARDPLRGSLFENLVILELVKSRLNQGLDPQLYFFRDQAGNEVDVIYKSANTLVPIEVKAGQTFHREFLKGVNYFKNLVGEERCRKGFVIYSGDMEQTMNDVTLLNFRNASQVLKAAEY